jgi:hypothetical protein
MLRMDIVNLMSRNSYKACNKLCIIQNIKEIGSAFEIAQEATEEWMLALALLPRELDEETNLMVKMIAELLVRLTTRGRQLEQWVMIKTECEYNGRLVSYMQDILEEWDEYSTNIRGAIEEDDAVRKLASKDIEAHATSNAARGTWGQWILVPDEPSTLTPDGLQYTIPIEGHAASNAEYESESDSDSSEYQDSDDEMTLDSTDDDSRCTRSIISILRDQEKRAGETVPETDRDDDMSDCTDYDARSNVSSISILKRVEETVIKTDKRTITTVTQVQEVEEELCKRDRRTDKMIVVNQDINDLTRQSDLEGETKVGSLNEQIEDRIVRKSNRSRWEMDTIKRWVRRIEKDKRIERNIGSVCHKIDLKLKTRKVWKTPKARARNKEIPVVNSIGRYICIPPCILSAVLKAGRRSGSTHRKRIPIVVTELPVMFIEPVCYESVDELQSPVELPSELTFLFFLPTVRTPQDFASHGG